MLKIVLSKNRNFTPKKCDVLTSKIQLIDLDYFIDQFIIIFEKEKKIHQYK